MNQPILIKNATIVNERKCMQTDVLIDGERIEKIGSINLSPNFQEVDGTGKHLLPGVIDGQVWLTAPVFFLSKLQTLARE